MPVMFRSRYVFGAAMGVLAGCAILLFVFRGGHSGVSVMTGLVIAGAVLGLSLGGMVGLWRFKQPDAASPVPTGDWRDFFRRR